MSATEVCAPPALKAVTAARAFEVMLPTHTRGLALTHNEHKDHARSLSPYVGQEKLAFVSDLEQQKALATNELWILYWHDPVSGERRIGAATLTGIAQWLEDTGLAFGN